MDEDRAVREQLVALLSGGHAHMSFERAVAGFPLEDINREVAGLGYTPWRLLEHIRIAQNDILEFIRDPAYVSPPWPTGYWPPEGAEADAAAWERTLAGFQADRQALLAMLRDPAVDLYTPLPHGQGQNILREMLLVADHSAYHLGEFGLVRGVLGNWTAARA